VTLDAYEAGFREGLRPDPELTVSEWSDKHRRLSSKASAEPGPWRTDRTPYLREIMDSLSVYDPCQRVVFKKSAQIGGTEAGNNWLGYVVMHAPAPMLYVQPTVEIAQKVSKQRVAPLIEETPELAALIAPSRSRDSGNTLLVKEFRGGVLMMTGANSAAGLRSMPIRFLFLDEIDAYPGDVEGEGDPVGLAEKRTTTFARRKVFLVSTPTIKDTSKIDREWLRSDQRRFFVACPHCGHRDWLRWRGFNDDQDDPQAKSYRLVWLDEAKTAAGYLCGGCGVAIEERFKTELLASGAWQATATGDGVTRGYHISALYSPAGWKSWVEILREFEESAHDPAKLKVFVNTVLGEVFEEAYATRLDADGLAKRAGAHHHYGLLEAPMPALILLAGVDVQRNRIHVVQRAFGVWEESWLVNRAVIYGDPYRGELWAQLADLLNTPVRHASGGELLTYAAAVDSGDGETAHEVYEFTRANRRRNFIATKGQSQPGKVALGAPTKVDINKRNEKVKRGGLVYPVGSDTIKTLIHGRLRNPEPGPGCYHWPLGLPDEYWQQLTSEKQVVKLLNGFPKRVWVKPDNVRNEDLDCEVLAYAALQYAYTRHNRQTMWAQFAARLPLAPPDSAESEPDATAAEEAMPPASGGGLKVTLSGWRRG
jgi:phage terminase large subunit GpA-like protein